MQTAIPTTMDMTMNNGMRMDITIIKQTMEIITIKEVMKRMRIISKRTK